MPQLRKRIKTAKPETDFDKTLEQELLAAWIELSTILNKGLVFADNLNATTNAVADTGLANAEFTITHGLKRVPTGYLVIRRNKAGVVYDSGTTFTATTIYLKCSVANCTLTVIVF